MNLADHPDVAQKRCFLRHFPEPRFIRCIQIALQEGVEEPQGCIIGKAHVFLDNFRVIFSEDHIEIIQAGDFRNRMSSGEPVHIDEKGLAFQQEDISRMEITVDQGSCVRQVLYQLDAFFTEDFIFIADSPAYIGKQPVCSRRESILLFNRNTVNHTGKIGHHDGIAFHTLRIHLYVLRNRIGVEEFIHCAILMAVRSGHHIFGKRRQRLVDPLSSGYAHNGYDPK